MVQNAHEMKGWESFQRILWVVVFNPLSICMYIFCESFCNVCVSWRRRLAEKNHGGLGCQSKRPGRREEGSRSQEIAWRAIGLANSMPLAFIFPRLFLLQKEDSQKKNKLASWKELIISTDGKHKARGPNPAFTLFYPAWHPVSTRRQCRAPCP